MPNHSIKKKKSLPSNITIDEKDSTTAGVFNSLDQTASKTEEFVAKNQKAIFNSLYNSHYISCNT